eukprot:TRINITY_DN17976_c0_g1_i1.p1 TRINITY_DN17976_c0_g1~~TRINITY_DN17976_c0_g1_i1.p1  ORF type:complete len:513 (+),score=71.26 TRINITY_DN17976_c0_g1_i1:184-1722(+)
MRSRRLICDLCQSAAPRFFCEADEAFLCAPCDAGIHGANALAQRHKRAPLDAEGYPMLSKARADKPGKSAVDPVPTKPHVVPHMKEEPSTKRRRSSGQLLCRTSCRAVLQNGALQEVPVLQQGSNATEEAHDCKTRVDATKVNCKGPVVKTEFPDKEFDLNNSQLPNSETELWARSCIGEHEDGSPGEESERCQECPDTCSFFYEDVEERFRHEISHTLPLIVGPRESSTITCSSTEESDSPSFDGGFYSGGMQWDVWPDERFREYGDGWQWPEVDDGGVCGVNILLDVKKDDFRGCSLRLDYEDVLSAWSGREGGTLWPHASKLQTVPAEPGKEDQMEQAGVALKHNSGGEELHRSKPLPGVSYELLRKRPEQVAVTKEQSPKDVGEKGSNYKIETTQNVKQQAVMGQWCASPKYEPVWEMQDGSGLTVCESPLDGVVPTMHVKESMGDGVEGEPMIPREARVMRYREKRRTRLVGKKIRYEVRKLNAERRPRVKGRFIKRGDVVSVPVIS